MKIMVVKDTESEDIEFICKTIGTKPVAHVDQFTADMLGSAELAEEVSLNGSGKLIKVTIKIKFLFAWDLGFFLILQIT